MKPPLEVVVATDYALLVRNVLGFYDFTDRVVLSVGAGGGQLIEYARKARNVLAVDNDEAALQRLAQRAQQTGLEGKFELRCEAFEATRRHADVVILEFSLHEMSDPAAALRRSRCLAPDTVVLDHSPGSEWAWYVAEEEKVERSWKATAALPIRSRVHHETVQRFATWDELRDKVSPQGAVSLGRIERFRGARDIVIPMGYDLALV